jgi:signal transduction histidine kinase
MVDRAHTHADFRAFLRSRWPSRTRLLAMHALGGSLIFVPLDWFFTRGQAAPPGLLFIAALRLPWCAIPLAGLLLQRRAPGWRHLPAAVIALSVLWAWGAVLGYYAIGLEGSVLQAITLFACLVTAAALLPVTGAVRAGIFALMALGFVAFDLWWARRGPLAGRLADDAAVLLFALVQIQVFQAFARAQRKGVLLRHRLEHAVTELAASRRRAAEGVAEVGRLAAEVAHEVNNPLSAVKVNVRWLASEGTEPAHATERAEVVVESLQAIDRIAAIVLELRQRAVEQGEAVHEQDASTTALEKLAP